jgi:1-pyrroline-5-carboxylate dehydrogenase
MGPVIDRRAYRNYMEYCEELSQASRILIGRKHLTAGELSQGCFCAPTIVDDLPFEHRLWKQEMFLPIVTLPAVDNLDEAIRHANDVDFGLTAGLFGNDPEEIAQFLDRVQAGVTYVNRKGGRPQGRGSDTRRSADGKAPAAPVRPRAAFITCSRAAVYA